MKMAEATASAKHVVLFPFPGQGHLSAFMSLAGLLHGALPDAAISLISTPRNIAALRDAGMPASSPFALHALPFTPAEHGLPPHCESADALQPSSIVDLMEAFEALQPAFDDYLAGVVAAAGGGGVCVVVSDAFTAWTVAVARRLACGHALFISCGAFETAVLHSLWSHIPVRPDPATGRVHLPEHPEVAIHRSQVSRLTLLSAGGKDDRGGAFWDRQISFGHKTDALLINTLEELEPAGLAMVRRAINTPVYPIGPLVRGRATSWLSSSPGTDAAILSFLDAHPPSSVLYISFGSVYWIRAEHMTELAAALESTGRPFVWAVRSPTGHDLKGDFRAEQWLPDGFEERARTSNRGLLVRGWAPQVSILAHASTGAFLSHCGWNSVLESMAHGLPIVGWPLAAEQFYNAKMLDEEWGVCVEVARGNTEDMVVDRVAVADVLETVMGSTAKAAEMRQRAAKIKKVMEAPWKEGGGSSRKALEGFLLKMKLRAVKVD